MTYRQFVTECDGDEDSEADLEDIFESLVLDIDPCGTSTTGDDTSAYLTTFGELTPDDATTVSQELANQALTHALTQGASGCQGTQELAAYTSTVRNRYSADVF